MPAEIVDLLIYLFTDVLDGRNASLTDGVERALGRPARDFADYARDTAATGVWNVGAGHEPQERAGRLAARRDHHHRAHGRCVRRLRPHHHAGPHSTDDRTFVTAFQAIDRAIINPLFMLTFFGALVASGIAGGALPS